MTRTTPELAFPSPNFHLAPTDFKCTRPAHTEVFPVESGFEHGTLPPRGRDFTTRPPRLPSDSGIHNPGTPASGIQIQCIKIVPV
ncbi:hypothetical protein AVEN_12559-1 [Araneus ventricosus]|uniref:Uncharacterized protein n=1 Tax=Araneus ventricosus TaxID=182803 RepID=A0A4Y2AAL3_ARAVE|nr:hypothetical protein AVEN_12559-1 [Araneus ventricosus]